MPAVHAGAAAEPLTPSRFYIDLLNSVGQLQEVLISGERLQWEELSQYFLRDGTLVTRQTVFEGYQRKERLCKDLIKQLQRKDIEIEELKVCSSVDHACL